MIQRYDHLNLYHYYSQQGESTLPYENNLSRVLAIILDENPAVFFMFINLLNNKLDVNDNIKNIEDGYEVGFQKNTKDNFFCNTKKVYGFTLTTEDNEGLELKNDKTDRNQISDISIIINDIAILIEVKRHGGVFSAGGQLNLQMSTLKDEFDTEAEKITLVNPKSLTWTEIINLLQNYKQISCETNNRIIDDYLTELKRVHSDWFPELPFSQIDDSELITNRLNSLVENYANAKGYELSNDAILLKYKWCERIAFWYDDIDNTINTCVWAFDTSTQYWRHKNRKFILQNEKIVKIKDLDVKFSFNRYIKIAGWHYSKSAYANLNDNTDDSLINFIQDNIRKWHEDEYDKLLTVINNDKFVTSEQFSKLKREFDDGFGGGKRKDANVSIGCSITCKIDYSNLKKIDKTKSGEAIFDLFDDIIKEYGVIADS